MFEVITQSQPQDYQSLEILKEAYFKLGRPKDVVNTSKRIAEAYVQLGQLSSAILEYESILQRFPDDPEVRAALDAIENRANSFGGGAPAAEAEPAPKPAAEPARAATRASKTSAPEVEDGRAAMQKIFVDGKLVGLDDFNRYWPTPDLPALDQQVQEPFLQILQDKGVLPLEKSIKLVCDKARLGYLPVEKYEIDIELVRRFPRDTCLRWCVVPFDRMSKSILVATANPFNKQAAAELEKAMPGRYLWYVAQPPELMKLLRKIFR